MRFAYVTFLMRGDSYLPGALVLAYALRLENTHHCVCLVTSDVSEGVRTALALLYDSVITIDCIKLKSDIQTGRRDRDFLFTRFEALRLGADGDLCAGYDKILLLDADVLPLGGYNDLFSLTAPAGIIMEHKNECYRHPNQDGTWSWHQLYNQLCPHGARIPKSLTERVRRDPANMGVNAGLWLIEPSMKEYRGALEALSDKEVRHLVTRCFPWPEMQFGTLLWSGRWSNVDIRYCSIGGYPEARFLYGVHFAGLKPWQINHRSIAHYARYPDFKLWYQFYTAMYWSYAGLRDISGLKRLWEFCRGKCV